MDFHDEEEYLARDKAYFTKTGKSIFGKLFAILTNLSAVVEGEERSQKCDTSAEKLDWE